MSRRRIVAFLALFGLLWAGPVACPSPSETDTPDVGVDVGDSDVGDGEEAACVFQNDCADTEYCFEGECFEAPTCNSMARWSRCVDRFAEVSDDLARRAYCDGERCRVSCLLDEECHPEEICSDHGRCIPFTGELTGIHPGGDEPAPLQVGVGNTLMHFPIGLSQGGYGSRMMFNGGRYVESLRPTRGKMHGLYTRGVALDDGTRQLIFLRAPIIFPSLALHESVSRELQEATGRDWRSSLVISGTHTHSGPARYWQIPRPETTSLPMGTLGIDEFHQEVYDWLVKSITEAALAALDDLQPAKMGWTVVESFDTDDSISSDRWGEKPPFDDNRVLLIRVDDLDDNPRALLVSFGTHGTVHSGSYMNNDVMVGIERQLEYALGDAFDTYAPVMYFNQNGGNMSPRGDRQGHRHSQVFENLGAHLVDRTFDAIVNMETTTEWSFAGHTHRFPIIYEYFDYGHHEFGAPGEATRDEAYLFGGLMCSLQGSNDYTDYVRPEDYGCMGIHQLAHHRPISLFAKSQISAFQLNDLTIVTMPGELTMPMGWQVQRDIRDAFGIDPFNSFTWGYAQDHLLYLTPTNLRGDRPPFPGLSLPEHYTSLDDLPDYALSYLQGGYESEMSPWGHGMGDFLAARAVEAVGLMRGEEIVLEYPVPKPDEFSRIDEAPFPIDTSDPDDVGRIIEQPPAQVERRQPVDIVFRGGDPGAEMPQAPRVTLEFAADGENFEPVLARNRAVYDNREFLMLTRVRRATDGADAWEWGVYWEELKDFPLGTYRFRINGHYQAESGERTPYESFTDAFELVPSTAIVIDEVTILDNNTIGFRLSYPPAVELATGGPSSDPGRPSGSFRMHHRWTPSGWPIPVEADSEFDSAQATITQSGAPVLVGDITVSTATESVENRNVPVTRGQIQLQTPLIGGAVEVEIEVADVFGNRGSVTVSL